jgi:predicted DNA-binding transcriptional regulator AlpA
MVDADDLVSASEIATRLGAKRPGVVHDWRRRHPEFPQPIARLALGFVWSWSDIETWARATDRLYMPPASPHRSPERPEPGVSGRS